MIIFGIGYFAWEIYLLWLGSLSKNWPATTCTILESFVDEEDNDGVVYLPKVRYSYKVGTKIYQSSRFSYQSLSLTTLGEASDFLRGISKGKTVPVFYDPKSPSRSVLLRGYNSRNFLGLFIISVILVIIVYEPLA